MKFFNWMLRNSHQSTDYSLVSYTKDAPCVESGAKAVESDTETLLNHMLDSFLNIGTLGHTNPLHLSLNPEEGQKAAAAAKSKVEAQAEPKASQLAKSVPAPARKQGVHITSQPMEAETIQMPSFEEYKRPSCEIIEPLLIIGADTGRRTTLADLFAVDAEEMSSGNALNKENKKSVDAKTSKKEVLKGDYSPPMQLPAITKKIHRLLTNMLKKKIHPDLGQLKSRAMDVKDDEEQDRFLLISCANFGAKSNFSMAKNDPHGGEVCWRSFL